MPGTMRYSDFTNSTSAEPVLKEVAESRRKKKKRNGNGGNEARAEAIRRLLSK